MIEKPNVNTNYELSVDYLRRLATAINRMLEDNFMAQFITDRMPGTSLTGDKVTFGFPPMTTTERNVLTPYNGQTIFNTTTNKAECYNGSWNPLW